MLKIFFKNRYARLKNRYFIGKQNIYIYRDIDKIAQPYSLLSYHSFRIESAELLEQLSASQLAFALVAVQTSVPQLLHNLAQLLVHLLAALRDALKLCTEALLPLTVILKA